MTMIWRRFYLTNHPIRKQTHEALDKTVKGVQHVGERVREAGEEVVEGGRKFWDRLKDTVMEDQQVPSVGERIKETKEAVKGKVQEAVKGKAEEKLKVKTEETLTGDTEEAMKEKLEDRGYNK